MSDYCPCGAQATARCTRCATTLCVLHAVSDDVVGVLVDELAPRRIRCADCAWREVEERIPEILTLLRSRGATSPEHVGAYLARRGRWHMPARPDQPLARHVITAFAGTAPPWVLEEEVQSMVALFARVAPHSALDTVPWALVGPPRRFRSNIRARGSFEVWVVSFVDEGMHRNYAVSPTGGMAELRSGERVGYALTAPVDFESVHRDLTRPVESIKSFFVSRLLVPRLAERVLEYSNAPSTLR